MNYDSTYEDQIKREPNPVALGAPQNIVRRQPTPHCHHDRDQVHKHTQSQNHGAQALRRPKAHLHTGSHRSPDKAALKMARLRPAMPAVGEIPLGQRSVQLRWVWQA